MQKYFIHKKDKHLQNICRIYMKENTFIAGNERRFGYSEVYPASEWKF